MHFIIIVMYFISITQHVHFACVHRKHHASTFGLSPVAISALSRYWLPYHMRPCLMCLQHCTNTVHIIWHGTINMFCAMLKFYRSHEIFFIRYSWWRYQNSREFFLAHLDIMARPNQSLFTAIMECFAVVILYLTYNVILRFNEL